MIHFYELKLKTFDLLDTDSLQGARTALNSAHQTVAYLPWSLISIGSSHSNRRSVHSPRQLVLVAFTSSFFHGMLAPHSDASALSFACAFCTRAAPEC
ncbi:hypothetical protein BaRGS_00037961 [Batillaria attramentaria]|uniref:Uncharacterized protein n=1 Tax=Batillaria attramentaria TaxID=370345 RepID=A0ABD0J7H4_9CAEN